MLAGWLNRQQQEMLEYLKEENRILRESIEGKRVLLNDSQKRRLAVLGKKENSMGNTVAHATF
jgi:hypothetical protein